MTFPKIYISLLSSFFQSTAYLRGGGLSSVCMFHLTAAHFRFTDELCQMLLKLIITLNLARQFTLTAASFPRSHLIGVRMIFFFFFFAFVLLYNKNGESVQWKQEYMHGRNKMVLFLQHANIVNVNLHKHTGLLNYETALLIYLN